MNISIKKDTKVVSNMEDAIANFFGGSINEGFKKIIEVAVDGVLGNASVGEHEGTNMFIQWSDNALLRLDAYYYRWNFSSSEIIRHVEGVSGVLIIKRVINLVTTDPQVITWAISKQAESLGEEEATKMIANAVSFIKKVTRLQDAIEDKEDKEGKEGIGQKTDH